MILNVPITNVIWEFKGVDDGYLFYEDIYWRKLSIDKASVCEYAYNNSMEKVSINNNEYIFDVRNMIMFIGIDSFISPDIPIRRSY